MTCPVTRLVTRPVTRRRPIVIESDVTVQIYEPFVNLHSVWKCADDGATTPDTKRVFNTTQSAYLQLCKLLSAITCVSIVFLRYQFPVVH